MSNKFVITGGPGSGKSTLCEALKKEGYLCFDEVSRQVIKREAQKKDGILPWENMPGFAELVLEEMKLQCQEAATENHVCFFDRGIPDIVGYMQHHNHSIPTHYYECLQKCNYNRNVFILPPWPDIYVQDSERWHSFEESVDLYFTLCETYSKLGYVMWELPMCKPEDRVSYMLNLIENFQPSLFQNIS